MWTLRPIMPLTIGKLRDIKYKGKYGWLKSFFFFFLLLLLQSLGWGLQRASCAWHLIHHRGGENCEMTRPSDVRRRGADEDKPNMVQQTQSDKSMVQKSFCMHCLTPYWLIGMYVGRVATEMSNWAGRLLIGRHPAPSLEGVCGYCTFRKGINILNLS